MDVVGDYYAVWHMKMKYREVNKDKIKKRLKMYYKENKEKLPKIGSKIEIDDKIGTVLSINVLSKKYKVTFENEVKEFTIDEQK